MTWRYILKQLAFPPSSLLLLLTLAWLLRKKLPRFSCVLFIGSLSTFYLLSLPATVQFLAWQLESEPALAQPRWSTLSEQADAIVVLGGGRQIADAAWDSDQPSLYAQQRLRYAARLARASQLPILVSGGLHFGQPPSEADIAADVLLQDFSMPTAWLEDSSRTTWENAQNSATLLAPLSIRRVVLVTDAWHMPRARWSFEQAGFTVISAPQGFLGNSQKLPLYDLLPDGKSFWQNTTLINELLGSLIYKWQYAQQ